MAAGPPRRVVEAVHLGEVEPAVAGAADERAPAAGAEIDGDVQGAGVLTVARRPGSTLPQERLRQPAVHRDDVARRPPAAIAGQPEDGLGAQLRRDRFA